MTGIQADRPAPALAVALDVFLCHNNVDRDVVLRVRSALERRERSAWLDATEQPTSDGLLPWIEERMRAARAIAVFLGPSGFGKTHFAEASVAVDLQLRQGVFVIPVLLPGTTPDQLTYFLRRYPWIQCPPLNDEAVAEHIAEELDRRVPRPAAPRPPAESARPDAAALAGGGEEQVDTGLALQRLKAKLAEYNIT